MDMAISEFFHQLSVLWHIIPTFYYGSHLYLNASPALSAKVVENRYTDLDINHSVKWVANFNFDRGYFFGCSSESHHIWGFFDDFILQSCNQGKMAQIQLGGCYRLYSDNNGIILCTIRIVLCNST
jgi:hypothetical protein